MNNQCFGLRFDVQESHFEEKGVLTPEEFVAAGDQLVRTCPTWQWESGDESKSRTYLPVDKQYLITRNVPCLRRVKALECDNQEEVEVEGMAGDTEGWVATHGSLKGGRNSCNEEDIGTIGGNGILEDSAEEGPGDHAVDSDEDSYINIDDFIEDGLKNEFDSATLSTDGNTKPNDNLLRTRTYDLSITYDKYYQTPRIWLLGYNEDGVPLTPPEMFQDIMQDYANKTVTMEAHPHIVSNSARASVHRKHSIRPTINLT